MIPFELKASNRFRCRYPLEKVKAFGCLRENAYAEFEMSETLQHLSLKLKSTSKHLKQIFTVDNHSTDST